MGHLTDVFVTAALIACTASLLCGHVSESISPDREEESAGD